MKTFRCRCGNRLFFDNTRCLECARQVGFAVEDGTLVPLVGAKDHAGHALRPCANYDERGRCNWLVSADDGSDLCLACRLNVEVPESDESETLVRNVELAKRRLIYSLLGLGLPVVPKSKHEAGVGFALRKSGPESPVITGHENGLITLDLNEADPAERAKIRAALGEDYRTVLGHFRHEIGHYYWTLFFADEASQTAFREVFGDERADYAKALAAHYAHPKADFQKTHISSYATSHPWEDWAETWAHYLHILDSWETATSFGLRTKAGGIPSRSESGFSAFLDHWSELMIAINSMNRSMGHNDAYPFILAPLVRTKLAYVDKTVRDHVGHLKDRFQPVVSATGSD
jgi:hypothetical protein